MTFCMLAGTAGVAGALDPDDFSCTFNNFWDGTFKKQGAKAVLTTQNPASKDLEVSEFDCDTGVSTRYADNMFCSRTENYGAVARSTTHLVFLNNYSSLVVSISSRDPDGRVIKFGTSAIILSAGCD